MGAAGAATPAMRNEPSSTGWPKSSTAKVALMNLFVFTLMSAPLGCGTHFLILTVTCPAWPGTLTSPSLLISFLQGQCTYSTANGPTPLAMFPQLPEKSTAPPSIGTWTKV